MNFCKDFVEQVRAVDLDTQTDMDAHAAEVIDWLYAEIVDKTGRVDGMSNFDYAAEILNVDHRSR